ncbi:formylglycine-generating enzyme family protein [Pseudoalteromonas rubra]|uniref:Sulfatase-modifying factor enzyme-like domain-containing protein n=1 Tax=Pseudoalteromonas rubra TaxID=43658 RepID=A0A5S3WU02_9GAMM|nr:SUMF1/EgtB/PvdO family nonheme iron enzyme [Pseudoalteromonas rubra]TMP32042.1 hypothetical protein CWB98_21895 [Pseudoalteromonas rubra]
MPSIADALRVIYELGDAHLNLDLALEALGVTRANQVSRNQTPDASSAQSSALTVSSGLEANLGRELDEQQAHIVYTDPFYQPTIVLNQKYRKKVLQNSNSVSSEIDSNLQDFITAEAREAPRMKSLWDVSRGQQNSHLLKVTQSLGQPDFSELTRLIVTRQPFRKIPYINQNKYPSEVCVYVDVTHEQFLWLDDVQELLNLLQRAMGERAICHYCEYLRLEADRILWRTETRTLLKKGFPPLPPANADVVWVGLTHPRNIPLLGSWLGSLSSHSNRIVHIPWTFLSRKHLNQKAIDLSVVDKLISALSLTPSFVTLSMIRELRCTLSVEDVSIEPILVQHDAIKWYEHCNRGCWEGSAKLWQLACADEFTSEKESEQLISSIESYIPYDSQLYLFYLNCLTYLPLLSEETKLRLTNSCNSYFGKLKSYTEQKLSANVDSLVSLEEDAWWLQQASSSAYNSDILETAQQAFTLINLNWQSRSGEAYRLECIDPEMWQQYQAGLEARFPSKLISTGSELKIVAKDEPYTGLPVCQLMDRSIQDENIGIETDKIYIPKMEMDAVRLSHLFEVRHYQSAFESLSLQFVSLSYFDWADSVEINRHGVTAETPFATVFWSCEVEHHGPDIIIKPEADGFISKHRLGVDEYGLYCEVRIKSTALKLRYIPAGAFTMGWSEGESQRNFATKMPVAPLRIKREVLLDAGFWMSEVPVTHKHWRLLNMDQPGLGREQNDSEPIVHISKLDALHYVSNMNNALHTEGFNLPSEAQWEYACRAGSYTLFSSGTSANVNCNRDFPYGSTTDTAALKEVYSYPANRWGLYQMHGNVWEWCLDDCEDPTPSDEISLNPLGDLDSAQSALRGGSWRVPSLVCSSSQRARPLSTWQDDDVGMRIIWQQADLEQNHAEYDVQRLYLHYLERRLPPDPETFPLHFATAWGLDEYGFWQTITLGTQPLRLRFIPVGSFYMGSAFQKQSLDQHEIRKQPLLKNGFWLADTLLSESITQLLLEGQCNEEKHNVAQSNLSWFNCELLLHKINQSMNTHGFDFPSDSQWEYACRAGSQSAFAFGSELKPSDAVFGRQSVESLIMKSARANRWGLYDMHGLLYEWCRYDSERGRQGRSMPISGLNSQVGILRGGSWSSSANECRCAHSLNAEKFRASAQFGLRLAFNP